MGLLPFAQLVVQLLRYKDELSSHGFSIDLLKDQNMYKDTLVVKKKYGFKEFQFSTQPYLWDAHKQFTIQNSTGYDKFIYKIDSISGTPVRCFLPGVPLYVNNNNMPNEMVPFGNDIYEIIVKVNQQVQNDKLNMNGKSGWALD